LGHDQQKERMIMGTTPLFNLPYPDLADPANPPIDIRELAEAIETILSKQTPLPPAQVNFSSTDQIITSSTSHTELSGKKRVTLTNPSDRVPMLVRVMGNGWLLLEKGTNITAYGEMMIISGVCTSIYQTGLRHHMIGANSDYVDFLMERMVYIPPLQTCTFGMGMWRLAGGGGQAIARSANVTAVPYSFTGPSIPSYPDPSPPPTG
jgi:hypothetical protein